MDQSFSIVLQKSGQVSVVKRDKKRYIPGNITHQEKPVAPYGGVVICRRK
jgi:hypothetical protein